MKLNNIANVVGVVLLALYGQAALANSTIDTKYLGSAWGYKSGTVTPSPYGVNHSANVSIGAFKMHNETSSSFDFAAANDNATTKTTADEFIAWCVDPLHWLKTNAHYNVGGTAEMLSTGGFSLTRVNNLQKLADHFYGDVNTAVESAAFQVATWTILYGSDTNSDGVNDFAHNSGSTFQAWNLANDVKNTALSYLSNLSSGKAANHYKISYLFDDSYKQGSDSRYYTQDLVTFTPSPVPLPAALPLMLSGLGVLGFASRRKRNPVA